MMMPLKEKKKTKSFRGRCASHELVKYPAPGFRLAARPANIHNLPCTEGRRADPEGLGSSRSHLQPHRDTDGCSMPVWILQDLRVAPAADQSPLQCGGSSMTRAHVPDPAVTLLPVVKRALLFIPEGATVSPRRWKRGTMGFKASDAQIPHRAQVFLLGAPRRFVRSQRGWQCPSLS